MDHFDERLYLEERYGGERGPRPLPLRAYYRLKPLLPRRLQLSMRRAYSKRQRQAEFPRWPIEPILVDHQREALADRVAERGGRPLPTIAAWPDDKRFAAVLTHDVESEAGVANVRRIVEIEARHGFVSSWNFVAEWYPIDDGVFDYVRARGGEIGLHAVKHDCKLFGSREQFERELPAIHRYLADWEVEGFRSPATHRNPDWMPELGARYDSSFPDTDPFEPQAGGCCSILPFFLDDLVELPITLTQDHTLWEILCEDTIDLWTRKSDWLIENGGLINLITHPDYLDTPARLRMYEEFIVYLSEQQDGWNALPREVAAWWRTRADLRLVETDGEARIEGDGAERARIDWAHLEGGELKVAPTMAVA